MHDGRRSGEPIEASLDSQPPLTTILLGRARRLGYMTIAVRDCRLNIRQATATTERFIPFMLFPEEDQASEDFDGFVLEFFLAGAPLCPMTNLLKKTACH